jgi:hypothetical protein
MVLISTSIRMIKLECYAHLLKRIKQWQKKARRSQRGKEVMLAKNQITTSNSCLQIQQHCTIRTTLSWQATDIDF